MSNANDSSEELWDIVSFSARESLLLRSFLEYLRAWPDPSEKKQERLENWRNEIGLGLGNPAVDEMVSKAIRKVRDAPVGLRKTTLQEALGTAYSAYFGRSS